MKDAARSHILSRVFAVHFFAQRMFWSNALNDDLLPVHPSTLPLHRLSYAVDTPARFVPQFALNKHAN